MPSPLIIPEIGAGGVNVVNPPQTLDPDELLSGQNAETVPDPQSAIEQRPGMSKMNGSALSGAVASVLDVRTNMLTDSTPRLYAGRNVTTTAVSWRYTTDGTTWTGATTPTGPYTNGHTAPVVIGRRWIKGATIGKSFYFLDDTVPIGVHQWDGTTDTKITTIPPAVAATVLGTPLTPSIGLAGTTGGTTYSYKVVAIAGASHGAVSAAVTTTIGNATLNSTNYNYILPSDSPPIAGATSYDVYRTAGGATQGKIGSIAVSGGAFVAALNDTGLTGDASTAPTTASGTTAADVAAPLDLVTDGTSLFIAVLDVDATGPTEYGRLLKLNPITATWTQVGAPYPTASGNGTPGALALYGGAMTFGTYIGSATGATGYFYNTGQPLLGGGAAFLATAASRECLSLANFNGNLYAGMMTLATGATGSVSKRVPVDTWSVSFSSPATTLQNGFSSLYVYQGRLYAGLSTPDAAVSSAIYSTADGVNWVLEVTLDNQTTIGQMCQFGANLYVACPAIYIESKIYQRTAAGVWSTVDSSTQLTGVLGVVYP